MPIDTTPTPQQQKLLRERAERMKAWSEKAQSETDALIGQIPREERRVMGRTVRPLTKTALARDMKDAKQVRLSAEAGDAKAVEAERDAANDAVLATGMSKMNLGKGRKKTRSKRKGGRRKTRRRA